MSASFGLLTRSGVCEHAARGSDRCEGHVYEYVGTQPFSNCQWLEQGRAGVLFALRAPHAD